jgi:hypothetical protein
MPDDLSTPPHILGYLMVYADGGSTELPYRHFGRFLTALMAAIDMQEAHPAWHAAVIVGYRVVREDDVVPGSFRGLVLTRSRSGPQHGT